MTTSAPNPYQPPESALAEPATPTPLGRRIGWKIYLWVLVGLTPLALATFEAIRPLGFLDTAVSVVSFVGLFGYAYRRGLWSSRFWAAWLPIYVGWQVLFFWVLLPNGLAYVVPRAESWGWLDTFFALVLISPTVIALYRYAFRSPELWVTAKP